jgi:hypothetical protein
MSAALLLQLAMPVQAPSTSSLGRLKVLRVSNAFKRPVAQPPVVTPEEKTLQSMVETGIRSGAQQQRQQQQHQLQHLHL